MDGWIPEGYLQAETPAGIRLERHEAETAELRTRFEKLSAEVVDLRERNQQLSERESKQRGEIDLLTRENLELRAGARGGGPRAPRRAAASCRAPAGSAAGAYDPLRP